MGERELIDAHVHLWNPQQFRLAWLDHEPALNKPFGLAEYPHAGAGNTITGMVYVEVDAAPHYALLEAQWAADQAAHGARLQGIVAAAPVEHGDRMRSYLMALQSIGPLIKGVRRNLQGETDQAFCLQPDFMRGVQLVAEYGFSFDICIRHLKGMLSNVLDVGVTEAELKEYLHLEALSVRIVVQQVLDTFDPREIGEPWLEMTKLKSRPISLDIPPDLVIHADGGRTRQVIVNLLSNALKYSDAPAPIAISAQLLEATGEHVLGKPLIPGGSWVQINVRDWGLGVPPREQPLLFTRFVRLSRDAASATRGTGVGLYLCRILIQAMGGQIWVESTGVPGRGSVFSFVLPAAQDNTA